MAKASNHYKSVKLKPSAIATLERARPLIDTLSGFDKRKLSQSDAIEFCARLTERHLTGEFAATARAAGREAAMTDVVPVVLASLGIECEYNALTGVATLTVSDPRVTAEAIGLRVAEGETRVDVPLNGTAATIQ